MKAMKTRLKANNFCCLWKCIDFEGLWHLGLANLASCNIVCTDVDNHRNDLIYLATTKANFRKPFSLIGKWTFNHPISEGQMENAHHHHYSPRLSVDSNPFNYIHPKPAQWLKITQKVWFYNFVIESKDNFRVKKYFNKTLLVIFEGYASAHSYHVSEFSEWKWRVLERRKKGVRHLCS